MKRADFFSLLNSAVMKTLTTPLAKPIVEIAEESVRQIMPFACENGEEILRPLADTVSILCENRHDPLTTLEYAERAWEIYEGSMIANIDHQPA